MNTQRILRKNIEGNITLDSVITCIKERFEQKDYKMYATLEQLLIKAILGESFEEVLEKVIGFYYDNFNDDILRI